MSDYIELFEIGSRIFMLDRLFGYVIGYSKDSTFNLQYGNENEWYIETWHDVNGILIMKYLNELGLEVC